MIVAEAVGIRVEGSSRSGRARARDLGGFGSDSVRGEEECRREEFVVMIVFSLYRLFRCEGIQLGPGELDQKIRAHHEEEVTK